LGNGGKFEAMLFTTSGVHPLGFETECFGNGDGIYLEKKAKGENGMRECGADC
jgi:hypothetical protein